MNPDTAGAAAAFFAVATQIYLVQVFLGCLVVAPVIGYLALRKLAR